MNMAIETTRAASVARRLFFPKGRYEQDSPEDQVGPERDPENIRPVVQDFGFDPQRLQRRRPCLLVLPDGVERPSGGLRVGLGQRVAECREQPRRLNRVGFRPVVARRYPPLRSGDREDREHLPVQQGVQDIDLFVQFQQRLFRLRAVRGRFGVNGFYLFLQPVIAPIVEHRIERYVFVRKIHFFRKRILSDVKDRFAAPCLPVGQDAGQHLVGIQISVAVAVI